MPARDVPELEEPLLSLRDVTVAFGGVRAVDSLSFDVPSGAITSVIGPNGAGKTTVLNAVSGFVRARGSIRYRGQEIIRLGAHRRAPLGIGRTFQNLQLFSSMTLVENVTTGQHALLSGNPVTDILRFPVRREERLAFQRSLEILRLLGIEKYAHRKVEGLPFGIQKLGAVARALALNPRLLMLDEPAAGLNQAEAGALGELIVGLRRDLGLTALLVEHNMRLVMAISDRVVVMDGGRKLTEGAPAEVSREPDVIEAYLGKVADAAVAQEVHAELVDRP